MQRALKQKKHTRKAVKAVTIEYQHYSEQEKYKK